MTKEEILKIVKDSRTLEEQYGIGVREDTARTQVMVDIINAFESPKEIK